MFNARYGFSVASFSYLIVCILLADHGTHGRELRNKGFPLEGRQVVLGGSKCSGKTVEIQFAYSTAAISYIKRMATVAIANLTNGETPG